MSKNKCAVCNVVLSGQAVSWLTENDPVSICPSCYPDLRLIEIEKASWVEMLTLDLLGIALGFLVFSVLVMYAL